MIDGSPSKLLGLRDVRTSISVVEGGTGLPRFKKTRTLRRKELEEAKKALAAAEKTLDAATGASEKEAAELAKQAAATAVDAAETKLKYQQDELAHLLGSGKWYASSLLDIGHPVPVFRSTSAELCSIRF